MAGTSKLEQLATGRPDSYLPARTLAHLLRLPEPDRDRWTRNKAMHYVAGATAGAVRGLMSASNLRGPFASLMHANLRLSFDQTLENATGVGAPPWTWPRDELIIDWRTRRSTRSSQARSPTPPSHLCDQLGTAAGAPEAHEGVRVATMKGPRAPALLLGVGLGGFIDGILLHQVLQWHHMLTSTDEHPMTTVAGLEANTLADGLFHLATWTCVAAGSALLYTAWRDGRLAPPRRAHLGLLLTGWGLFNLVEGLIDPPAARRSPCTRRPRRPDRMGPRLPRPRRRPPYRRMVAHLERRGRESRAASVGNENSAVIAINSSGAWRTPDG